MPPKWRQPVPDWLTQIEACARDWRMGEVRSHLVPGGGHVQSSSGVQPGGRLKETEGRKRRPVTQTIQSSPHAGQRIGDQPDTNALMRTEDFLHSKSERAWLPHHRQVSVLRLGHDELRSRCKVDDPLFPLTHCKLYAAEERRRS